jgi:BirA family biotin operon repressor/biotin-[acetyl-CoA-carboxylase] ligase
VNEWGLLPLITGLGVALAVVDLGAGADLKWPNDVLLPDDDERKVCGILAELVAGPQGGVVVGMGLNVGQVRGELPVETATSLRLVGVSATRPQVVTAVLEELGEVYGQWDRYGWGAVKDAYEAACITLGRTVRVELPDGTAVLGTAQSIADDGRLVVMTTAGPRSFAAGDVHHLRAL